VGVVVLIGSVNLANLTVAGSARRRGELTMRAALGASRWDLVWTLLSETTLICAAGAALGVLLATQLLDPFLALLSRAANDFPRLDAVRVNGTVMMFSSAVTILTAVLSGLFPALSASSPARWEALHQGRRSRGGRATRRTQRSLLLVEAALATALLAVAGLLTRSALYASSVDPGFDSESLAYLSVESTGERYDTPVEAHALGEALETRLSMLPGVTSVARASAMPALGNANGKLVWLPGETPDDAQLMWTSAVSTGYFDAMGITLEAGRGFTTVDGPDDPKVVVVSELLAERYFPGEDAVGKPLMMSTDARLEGGRVLPGAATQVTVVGVVSDVRQLAVVMEPDPVFYMPITQTAGADPNMILRTEGDPAEILAAARAEIRAQDPSLLVSEAQMLDGAMRRLLAPLSVRMALIVGLAALAAFLTAVGIYGVVAYVVSDQLHEIGVRVALGARSAGETGRVVRHALTPVLLGAIFGLGGAWAVGGLIRSELFGVGTLDPATYLGVAALISSVSAFAAWVPARRAASVDPVQVLNDQ
jgi:predicted permease